MCTSCAYLAKKYDDDVLTIHSNQVRESMWSRFSVVTLLVGGRFL